MILSPEDEGFLLGFVWQANSHRDAVEGRKSAYHCQFSGGGAAPLEVWEGPGCLLQVSPELKLWLGAGWLTSGLFSQLFSSVY